MVILWLKAWQWCVALLMGGLLQAQVWINNILKPIITSRTSPSVPPFLAHLECLASLPLYSFVYVCVPVCEFFLKYMFGLTTIPASKHLKATYSILNSKRWKGRCLNKMYVVEQLDMPGTATIKHSAQHRSSDIAVRMGASDGDKQGFGPGLLNFEWAMLAGKEDGSQQATAPSFFSLVCPSCASSIDCMYWRECLHMGAIVL